MVLVTGELVDPATTIHWALVIRCHPEPRRRRRISRLVTRFLNWV